LGLLGKAGLPLNDLSRFSKRYPFPKEENDFVLKISSRVVPGAVLFKKMAVCSYNVAE